VKEYESPMGSNVSILHPKEQDKLITGEMQKRYRSGVGSLIYLVKHTRPNLSNSVRELAKVLDSATEAHLKFLVRAIKYTLDTKKYALQMKPSTNTTEEWKLEAYCDSDYSGDRDNQLSTTGYIIHVLGVPVAWKSRVQRSVTLSSTEAEYVAVSEVCTEILFIKQVLEFLGVKIAYPIVVNIDNIGSIYLAKNETMG